MGESSLSIDGGRINAHRSEVTLLRGGRLDLEVTGPGLALAVAARVDRDPIPLHVDPHDVTVEVALTFRWPEPGAPPAALDTTATETPHAQ